MNFLLKVAFACVRLQLSFFEFPVDVDWQLGKLFTISHLHETDSHDVIGEQMVSEAASLFD